MMKKMSVILIVLALIATPAFAASAWKQEGVPYTTKMPNKFAFGLMNVLLGWTEIIKQPYKSAEAHQCVFTGLGRGLWYAVADTVGGAVHLVTFWCPKTDVPLPEGGVLPNCCSTKAVK